MRTNNLTLNYENRFNKTINKFLTMQHYTQIIIDLIQNILHQTTNTIILYSCCFRYNEVEVATKTFFSGLGLFWTLDVVHLKADAKYGNEKIVFIKNV